MTDTYVTTGSDPEVDVSDEWAEWPESELEIDDEAFAEAIAEGRRLEAAA